MIKPKTKKQPPKATGRAHSSSEYVAVTGVPQTKPLGTVLQEFSNTIPLPAPNETLGQKQRRFSRMLTKLLERAFEEGYEVAIGECERPEITAQYYASKGIGIKNSLHRLRLAADLLLFRNGKYLTLTSDYEELGQYWEFIGGSWGGRFGDGNHFSLAHGRYK